jgi:hypothetical protein
MSPNQRDAGALDPLSAAAAAARVPQLASSGGGGGAHYAVWRPQMQTFLMRAGLEERDYAKAIPQWRELDAAVQADAQAADDAAVALLLSPPPAAAGPGPTSSTEASSSASNDKAQAKAKERVAEMMGRARKAFGFLYSALPSDLRLLVADVPQGYAYGIWSFLEKKFRNTEQDNVADLWKTYTSLAQEPGENFEEYKARVDSVLELLQHAKESPPPGLYSFTLIWRLQPRYYDAVLALKANGQMKDPAQVDWPAIAAFMANHERSLQRLGSTETADHVMGARSPGGQGSSSGDSRRKSERSAGGGHSGVECYYCHEFGHIAADCAQLKRKQERSERRRPDHPSGGAQIGRHATSSNTPRQASSKAPWAPRSNASSGSEGEDSKSRASSVERANAAMKTDSRYAALSRDSDVAEDTPMLSNGGAGVSYCALAMATQSREPQAHSQPCKPEKSALKKTVTFGPKTEQQVREAERRAPPKVDTKAQLQNVKATHQSIDTALKGRSQAVDTAASVPTTGNRHILLNLRRCPGLPIKVADGAIVTPRYQGDLPLRLPIAGQPDRFVEVIIPNVYYHEAFDANLLSWGMMRESGWQLHSTLEGTYLVTPDGHKVVASTRGRLTILDPAPLERVHSARLGRPMCRVAEELVLLHRRVGHVGFERLLKMCRASTTIGVASIEDMPAAELDKAEKLIKQCEACTRGKSTRQALGHEGLDKGKAPGEVLHMDSFHVKVRDPQTGGSLHTYGLVAVDGWTEHVWLRVAKDKVELQQAVMDVVHCAETMLEAKVQQIHRVKRLRTDGGDEFINGRVKAFCRNKGISLHFPPADNPELRGVAERAVRTVKDTARTMLIQANVPGALGWQHAAQHHAYLWNRTHVGRNTGKTPFEMMRGQQPSILHVGVFGCDVFVHQRRNQRESTFSSKALPGVYLGHDSQQNCPVVYMLDSGKKIRTKDVDFREGAFEHIRAVRHGRADEVAALDASSEALDAGDQSLVDDEASESDEEDAPAPVVTSKERYSIQRITNSRTTGGQLQYLVTWSGYPKATWEPATVIEDDAPEEVRKYKETVRRAEDGPARSTRSRAAAANDAAPATSELAQDDESVSEQSDGNDMIFTEQNEAAASAAQRL